MRYNFDQTNERRNTGSMKWDGVETFFGSPAKNSIPMWVADMDFKAPIEVIEALKQEAENGIFGYPIVTDSYYEAVIGWMNRRYQWSIKREWIHFTPGIVGALNYIVQAFTNEGDSVAIQSPVYYPFTNCVVNNGRNIVRNGLKFDGERYVMDYEDFEEKIVTNNVKLFILCNPHNPVGRVWTKEELIKLANICIKHNVLIVSDEIHGDLTYNGHKTIAFASISDKIAQNTIVCTAASKTFNLAGLQTSNIIIANESLSHQYSEYMKKLHLLRPNIFGKAATEAAYNFGEEWLEQLKEYLQQNLTYLIEFIEQRVSDIKVIKPEGTYLVWLDCTNLGMNIDELKDFMLEKANVAMDDGYLFGPGGEGFTRINIACPRATLKDALERIEKAINDRK